MTVGLVGLGGGNLHAAQQLAHVGVGHFVLADADHISLTNLNGLIGGGLTEHIRGSDVLVIEATFLDRDAAIARDYGHLTATEAAALAAMRASSCSS